jgi:ATP-independent RNA helicase DbpA
MYLFLLLVFKPHSGNQAKGRFMTIALSNDQQLHPVLGAFGFSSATRIQQEAIPVLASGGSLLALSPTGSGKTLAFLIPLMEKIDPQIAEIQLLILAPTRELGSQIAQVATQVAEQLSTGGRRCLQVRTAFGGHKAESQKIEILKKPAVVVATPGRALELIGQEILETKNLKSVVLDEADLLIGMGFEEQIKEICDHLPNRIQAALFSATESEGQSRLQNRLVHRGQRIDVRGRLQSEETAGSCSSSRIIHQILLIPHGTERLPALHQLLMQIDGDTETGIIFCQTRNSVQQVADFLKENGISAAGLSGELGQIERSTMMRHFKSGGLKYLVSTNLAARGIDVSDLSVVVHFELPSTQQEYLHRSGRSGRAGKSGRTISLCTPQSRTFLREILQGTEIELENLQISPVQPTELKAAVADFVKVHINRGKSSKLRPGDFLGALTKDLGLGREDVGGIFIFDHFTHVEISRSQLGCVLNKLSGRKIKNLAVKAAEASTLSNKRDFLEHKSNLR